MAYRIKWRWYHPFFHVLEWVGDSVWRILLVSVLVVVLLAWVAVQVDAWERRQCIQAGGHIVEEKIWVPQYTIIGKQSVYTGSTRQTVSHCEGARE